MTGIFSGAFAAFGFVVTLIGGYHLAGDKSAAILIWGGFGFIAISQRLAFLAGQERGR